MEILGKLQIIAVVIELIILVLYLLEKTDMKKKIALNEWLVTACIIITGLYFVSAVTIPEGKIMYTIVSLMWGACVYVWNRQLKLNKELYGEEDD